MLFAVDDIHLEKELQIAEGEYDVGGRAEGRHLPSVLLNQLFEVDA